MLPLLTDAAPRCPAVAGLGKPLNMISLLLLGRQSVPASGFCSVISSHPGQHLRRLALPGISAPMPLCALTSPLITSTKVGQQVQEKPPPSMPYCVVKGCQSNGKRYDPSTTLHSFPKDLHLIKRWLVQMPEDEEEIERLLQKIKGGKNLESFRMCSRHFTPDSYYVTKTGKKRLHKLALPSVFTEDSKISKGSDSLKLPPPKRRCLRNAKACPTCQRPFAEPEKVDIGVQTDDPYPGHQSTPPDSKDGIIDSKDARTILPLITVKQEHDV